MQPNINKIDIKLENISNTIFCFNFPNSKELNDSISTKFDIYKDHPNTRKTHLFEDRYENIYISSDQIEEIEIVLSYSKQCVEKITGKTTSNSGLWFNYMKPTEITLPHTHDDADELYSAVYYVKVPKNSGNLIITENNNDIVIEPKVGMLVLFPPNLVHHVTNNNSNETRLSLGINIGN